MSRFIVFDVETPNRKNNRISAIGITVVEEGKIIKEFEKLGGDIAHKDHKGRTFVDCLPSQNPDWSLLDPALNECRVKIEKMRLLDVVDSDGKKQKIKKKM